MEKKEQDKIVNSLSRYSDVELREILFAVFQTRRPDPEEDEYNKNYFFLGAASSLLESSEGESKRWEAWKIEAVAYIDREEYGEDVMQGVCDRLRNSLTPVNKGRGIQISEKALMIYC